MMKLDSDFFETLFASLPGAVAVFDHKSEEFIRVNDALALILGGQPKEIEGKKMPDFINNNELAVMQKTYEEQKSRGAKKFQFAVPLRCLDGKVIPIDFHLVPLEEPYETLSIGMFSDLTGERAKEEKFKDEIGSQREKTIQAFQANVRIWQITDMIRAAFNSMERLVDAKNEDELLQDTLELMTSTKGLDFKDVVIYLREDAVLKPVKSSEGFQVRAVNLSRDGRLVRFFNGSETAQDSKGNDKIVTLKGREGLNIGLLRVQEHGGKPAEMMTEPLLKMRESVLFTLANTLSLMIRNMRLHKSIQEQSIKDPLVDVFNRRYMERKFLDEIDRVVRYKHPMSVVMVDIDHFKQCNDSYGHLQGDSILKELGQIFNQRIRRSDTVCRYGGEEFVILLPETNLELGQTVAESILKMVRDFDFTNIDDGEPLKLTVSLGVTCFDNPEMISRENLKDKEEAAITNMLKEADEALYKAKDGGRNQVVVFERNQD
jgi:diguanylate cyclase (GGDEF)-like protein/PAS domain S-box-containing protein